MLMKKAAFPILSLLLLANSICSPARALQKDRPPDMPVDQLIRRIAVNESRLRDEYKTYLFKQDVTLQSLGGGNAVTGEFRRVSEIIVNDQGQREERILHFPPPTLTAVSVTQADYQDLAGVQPFALALEDLPKYKVTYVGREHIDELDTYIFDVQPAKPPNPKNINDRYFEGRVWVDTVDLVVVKVAGRGLPEDDRNKFPRFETWRENIDKGIWFPTYTYADDYLDFPAGRIHLRMVVRYTNYRKFTGGLEVIPADEPLPQKQPPSPKPEQKPKP
ncbi:MAG: hypothetical protein HY314_04610 [Acidobacteria bacterium]|nr:hypothetical protein [Acidobacteriota bacterium]